MRNLWMLGLLAVLVATPASAKEREGLLSAANQCVTLDVSGEGTGTWEVTQAWAGTITFQVGGRGGTFNDVDASKADTPSTFVNNTNGNGVWGASVAGYAFMRACMTSYTSGTARVWLSSAPTGGGGAVGGSSTTTLTLQETDDGSIAGGQGADAVVSLNQVFDGTVWRRQTVGTAGTAAAQVVTVQGIASMTPILATVTASNLDVQIGGSDTVAVSNAGTFAVQSVEGAGALLTSAQLLDNAIGTVGAGTAATGSMLAGGVYNSTPITLTNTQGAALQVDVNGALKVTGASGTTQYTEDVTATDGASLVAMGVIRRDTTPTSSANAAGENAQLNADANGRLYTNTTLYDAAGSALTLAADKTEDVQESGGDTGPLVLGVRRDALVSSSNLSGDFSTFNFNNRGALWTSFDDPCTSEAKTTDPFSLTARGVIIAATAAKKNYICAIAIVAGTAEIANIVEGTGTTCQTSTAALVGSTTAANGLSFAANGGAMIGTGLGAVVNGKTSNVDTCLVPSGSNRLAGFVTWVQR
jgi:hypothetical protein